jgi:integrase
MRRKSNGWTFRRPDGSAWYIGYYVDGKRVREAAGSRKSDATALLQQRMRELDDGRWQAPSQPLTFEQLVDLVEADYRANGRKSLPRVEQCVAHLRGHFGRARATDITAARISTYLNDRLDAGAASATVRNELSVLKRGMNLAVRAGLLPTRPPFPTIRAANVRTGFFERSEFEALLVELPVPVRPVVRFLYATGWRRGEALSRQWRHVDTAAGIIRLEPGETKNGKGRTFPYAALPDLAGVLAQQRAYTEAVERRTGQVVPWVFHREGRPIKSFRTAWRAACRRVSLKAFAARQGVEPAALWRSLSPEERRDLKGLDRIPHDFRRTAVRNLERAGVSRSVAKALVGHLTDSVYERYAITSERDLAEGVEKLASLGQDRQVLPLPAPNRPRIGLAGRNR